MKLLALGNALLDMVVSVEPQFLEKHGLCPDSIQSVAENETLKGLLAEVSKMNNVVLKPGGSALNTVRMAQKVLAGLGTSSVEVLLLGSLGNDQTGHLLIKTLENEGIRFVTQRLENEVTGRCACLLTEGGSARTMVTDLGASLKFDYEIWKNAPDSVKLLEEISFVYISGYFLKVSPQTAMNIVRAVLPKNVPILLNLNAVWVTRVCRRELEEILPVVNVLFGNELEIRSFVKEVCLLPSDSDSINALQIASLLSTKLANNSVVIMTRAALPVIVAKSGQTKEYRVPAVSVVDSTGAGDAFVGGFLACYIQNTMEFDVCLSYAIWAASEELKGYGFILPAKIPNQLNNFFA